MKKSLLFISFFWLSIFAFSQAPQAIKYQAVARDLSGNPLINQEISIKISILSGSATGTLVYSELHELPTNEMGLFTLEIGNPGLVLFGSFEAINWGSNTHFLKLEIDANGGLNFHLMGVSQLLSVPYALYAKTAGNSFSGNFNDLTNKPTTVAGYGITDGMTIAHAANGITTGNIANWNTAFSWGNPAGLYRPIGYVPAWGEITSNPFLFTSVVNNQLLKYNTTTSKWENWTPNFLTGYTETDPIWTAASGSYYTRTNMQTSGAAALHFTNITSKPTTIAGYGITNAMTTAHVANGITSGNISNWNLAFGWGNHAAVGYLTNFTETDPIFGAHPAKGIGAINISNWNTAFSWGNHALAGYLTSFAENDPIWAAASGNYFTKTNMQTSGTASLHFNNLTNKPTTTAGYGITNAMTTSHPANGINSGSITNWNLAFGWGNHALAGYLTSFTETDPIFAAHPANGITLALINNWNSAYANRIISASGNTPLTLTLSNNELFGTITQANTTTNGYLTSTDWNSFNNKVSSQWVNNGMNIFFNLGSVGVGTSTPVASAEFEVNSTTKGFLPPRMTNDQMIAISNPQEGLMVYNLTTKSACFYNGDIWVCSGTDEHKNCGEINYGGQTYHTVIIGSQCWMKENLNIGDQISGSSNQSNNGVVEKYCYNNSTTNCNQYGGLYQWNEMMQYSIIPGVQGICPSGWHIPTSDELNSLVQFLNGNDIAGGKMKSLDFWSSPNEGATNSSGFTGHPGGRRLITGSYNDDNDAGYWWTSSETAYANSKAYLSYLSSSNTTVQDEALDKYYGHSVRCLKD